MYISSWTLTYQPPFNWQNMLAFFRHRAIPQVESVTEEEYLRSITLGDARGWIRISHDEANSALLLAIHIDKPDLEQQIVKRVRTIMDLDAPMADIEASLSRHEPFGELIKQYRGTRLPGCWDPFEFSVRAILGQQISVKAATTLAGRIAHQYGEPITGEAPDELGYYFPPSEKLAGKDFAGIGLTRTRTATLQNLALQVAEGNLRFTADEGLDDFVKRLVKEPGIGPWTAHYLAMRGMSLPDAFPASDLGIIKMLSSDDMLLKPKQIEQVSEQWRPWRAYAAIYLWQGLTS